MPSPSRPSALLVVNAEAGTADADRRAAVERAVAARMPVTTLRTPTRATLCAAVDDFTGDRVVVAGGDGTLHLVLDVMHERGRLDLPVAVVPLGTANDFAAGIGVPADPVEAAAAAAGTRSTPLDLLVADDGEVVVNAAHAGIGADATARAADLKPAVGALAYPLSTVVSLLGDESVAVRVAVDGAVLWDGPALAVVVANGVLLGGGSRLAPGAEASDGRLDVVVVTQVPPALLPGLAADVRRGDHLDRDDVAHARGGGVRIDAAQPIAHTRDGEPRGARRHVSYAMLAGAWRALHC